MNRRRTNQLLLLAGLTLAVAVLAAAGLGLPTPRARATELPPRPTLVPVPTEVPQDDDKNDALAPVGRITGTVIDLATGAPAPAVAVTVGGVVVQTDANGNYDLNGLPAGTYQVALSLTAEQGAAAQEPINLSLEPGAVLVQHLAYRSPAPPAAATPVADHAPVPQSLPDAGAATGEGMPWPLIGLALVALAGGGALRRATQR